jgi:hypothetical protein
MNLSAHFTLKSDEKFPEILPAAAAVFEF